MTLMFTFTGNNERNDAMREPHNDTFDRVVNMFPSDVDVAHVRTVDGATARKTIIRLDHVDVVEYTTRYDADDNVIDVAHTATLNND